jgi:hypothetical protein
MLLPCLLSCACRALWCMHCWHCRAWHPATDLDRCVSAVVAVLCASMSNSSSYSPVPAAYRVVYK